MGELEGAIFGREGKTGATIILTAVKIPTIAALMPEKKSIKYYYNILWSRKQTKVILKLINFINNNKWLCQTIHYLPDVF